MPSSPSEKKPAPPVATKPEKRASRINSKRASKSSSILSFISPPVSPRPLDEDPNASTAGTNSDTESPSTTESPSVTETSEIASERPTENNNKIATSETDLESSPPADLPEAKAEDTNDLDNTLHISVIPEPLSEDDLDNLDDDDDGDFPPPPPNDILDAVDRISSKYETPCVVPLQAGIDTQKELSESSVTEVGKNSPVGETASDGESGSVVGCADSKLSHSTDKSEIIDTNNGKRTVSAIGDSGRPSASLQFNSDLRQPSQIQVEVVDSDPKSPNVSSPLSEISNDSAVSVSTDDINNMATVSLEDPPTSGLETDGSDVAGNEVPPMVLQSSSFASVGDREDKENGRAVLESPYSRPVANRTLTLTVAQETNANAQSESGDSGIYSLVGETIKVNLRPTKNDNKKPEYAVPMFERNSADLKRVTFRDSRGQDITPAQVQRSAKELEQIKRTGLSVDDISQAEIFYKAHKTEVFVCPCLATLYFAEGISGDSVNVEDWKPAHIGIPVIIYDTGDGKRTRGLSLVFAEKGTGFSLWKSVINYESRWEVVEKNFHRMRVVGSADRLAGIAFQDEESAEMFYQYYKDCIADPELNVLNNPHIKPKKKNKKDRKTSKKIKVKPPLKTAISMPCEFTHITQLKQSEDGILALAMVTNDDCSSEDGTV